MLHDAHFHMTSSLLTEMKKHQILGIINLSNMISPITAALGTIFLKFLCFVL